VMMRTLQIRNLKRSFADAACLTVINLARTLAIDPDNR
jgi:hypothetical protein